MNRYEHGGNPTARLDFSANINPLGMPESVKRTLIDNIDSFCAYPDTDCRELTAKLSVYEGVGSERIVCGNGAADLIYRIVQAAKPRHALLISPTFSEYEKALYEAGCGVEYHALSPENGFALTESLLDCLTSDVDIFFLCNPNNPVGNIADAALIKRIIEACNDNNILFVVDECFMDFVPNGQAYSAKNYLSGRMVILRAFTKIYAMAGLRLGYALFSDASFAQTVRKTGQCWSVSAPAQLAGIAASDDTDYVRRTLALITAERGYMSSAIAGMGLTVFPSETNFLLICSPLPLADSLAAHGIAVRRCENYRGLDSRYIRVAVRTHSDNEALVRALERIINDGKS